MMAEAGIDTDFFVPYSTRAAASSAAAKKTHSLDLVLKMGNWRSECTFFKHYLRKVKYFTRTQKTHVTQGNGIKEFPYTPADGLITQARHSLKRAIKRSKNITSTPYVELPPRKQNYDTCSLTSSLNVLEIPNPPLPTSSIASSAFTDITDVSMCEEEHPDPREPKLTETVAETVTPHKGMLHKQIHPKSELVRPRQPTKTVNILPPRAPENQTQLSHSLQLGLSPQPNQTLLSSVTPATPLEQNTALPVFNTIFIAPPFQFAPPLVPPKLFMPKTKRKQKNTTKPTEIKPKPSPPQEPKVPMMYCNFECLETNISNQKRGAEYKLPLPAVFAGVDTFTSEDFRALRTEDRKTKVLTCAITKDRVLITRIPHDTDILFVDKFHALIRIFGNELDKNREISAALIACLKRKELRRPAITNTMLENCGVNHNTLRDVRILLLVIGTQHFLIYTSPIVTTEDICSIYAKHGVLIVEQDGSRFIVFNQREYNTLINDEGFALNHI